MTLKKIDDETVEETTEVKQTFLKKNLLAQKAGWEERIAEIDKKLAVLDTKQVVTK